MGNVGYRFCNRKKTVWNKDGSAFPGIFSCVCRDRTSCLRQNMMFYDTNHMVFGSE